ncbi:MAG: hypothetical protein K8H89_07270 [Flavobacteriales bacterium]|jgi:hypothetical protein|nr:hypothetical protein [Flavobacteriales bacterium]MCB0757003.1 hypothetical protein [Flavobacteriales bacterium]
MTTAALKAKLKEEIEKETDSGILKTIEQLLQSETRAERDKRRLLLVALSSEKDMEEGRTMTMEQAKLKLAGSIEQHRSERDRKAKGA